MDADEHRGGASGARGPLRPPWASAGTDLTRVLALSDGVFAFAMTLLVLGLALPIGFAPADIGAVLALLEPAFLAYVLSFAVIWLYWRSHHQIFGYVTGYDRLLLNANVAFLLFIAVMPFSTDLLAMASGEPIAVVIYALNQVAAGGLLALLWRHASRDRRLIDPRMPEPWIGYLTARSLVSPLVFAASVPLALVNPAIGEYAWTALFVLQVLLRRTRRGPGGSTG